MGTEGEEKENCKDSRLGAYESSSTPWVPETWYEMETNGQSSPDHSCVAELA